MPKPLSSKQDWPLANPIWANVLNPFLANLLNNVSILKNINLSTGVNVINHGLGRQMNGWFLVDIQAAQTVYRSAPFNSSTLTLTASGPVTCSIGVF